MIAGFLGRNFEGMLVHFLWIYGCTFTAFPQFMGMFFQLFPGLMDMLFKMFSKCMGGHFWVLNWTSPYVETKVIPHELPLLN